MPKDKKKQYESLRALFEKGSVKRMRDIQDLFPTMVATDLKMNHSRYINKLYKPELFTLAQVYRLGNLIGVDASLISNVILKEIENFTKGKKK